MPFQVVKYLSNLLSPTPCECCDHNFTPIEDEFEPKPEPRKKSLRSFFISFGANKSKTRSQVPHETDPQFSKERRFRRYVCLGKKKGRDVQRRLRISGVAHAVSAVNKHQYAKKSAVREVLHAIFTDIVETDSILESQMDATTQCFLVHIFSDINPEDSFLAQYRQLPPHTADMDLDHGLSFASTWLQNSLKMIRDGYEAGEARLQMPFSLLETNYHAACARASALQRQYPDEEAVIVTLDFMALKNAKLIASAEHTFNFLRASKESTDIKNRLLVWVEHGDNGQPAHSLLEAVLAIVKWQGSDNEVAIEDTGEVLSDSVEAEAASDDDTWKTAPDDMAGPSSSRKKDSVVTERTCFEEDLKTDGLYSNNFSTSD